MELYLTSSKTTERYDDTRGPDYSGHLDASYSHSDFKLFSTHKGLYNYDSLTVAEEYVKGDELWVCYCIYSTGDSFSRSEGSETELLFVTKDKEAALKAHKQLHNRKKGKGTSDYVETIRLNGKKIDVHIPWDGYFESLDSLVLTKMVLDEEGDTYVYSY